MYFRPHYVKNGLVLYLPMDSIVGGKVLDVSGNGNHGTVYGAVSVAGKRGRGLSFDGVDDYVSCPYSASLGINGNLSLGCFIKLAPGMKATVQHFTGVIGRNYTNYALELGKNSSSTLAAERLMLWKANGSGAFETQSYYRSFQEEIWYHIFVTFNSATLLATYYINGFPTYNRTCLSSATYVTNNPFYIGARSPSAYSFYGLIDEVMVYNRALTPAEIRYNYLARRDLMRIG